MTVKITLPFDQFLACHAAREDIIGTFARSAAKDPLLPSSANYRDYVDYFEGSGILSWVSEGFDIAWEEYSDLRFDATVLVTRSGDESWCIMFASAEIDDFIMDHENALNDARDRIEAAAKKLSGQALPRRYGFEPGATFVFPTVTEVTVDFADLAVDIEMTDYAKGIDMEIARAICDHVTEVAGFCARFEEDDVLTGWQEEDRAA